MHKRLCCLTMLFCLMFCATAQAAQVLYTGIITRNYANSETTVYAKMDKDSKRLAFYKPGKKIQVTAVYPYWVEISLGKSVGYVIRHRVDELVPLDPVNTPPYGVEKYAFYAEITQDTDVVDAPNEGAQVLSTLTPGAKIAFIGVENGWAKCIYHRQYAWVDTRKLEALNTVAESVDTMDASVPISVFVSFYNNNESRINNLMVGCTRMNRVMQPGDVLDFNNSVGPFRASLGYTMAPVLKDGEVTNGYGGGSCQISSSLYNTVLQLPGINILERFPHGSNGAPYLPHGVDASSGKLNFKIRNDYDFPIRIEGSCHDYAMFIAIYKEGA